MHGMGHIAEAGAENTAPWITLERMRAAADRSAGRDPSTRTPIDQAPFFQVSISR